MNNKIFPCFWMDGNAKEAALFYCKVFKETGIVGDNPYVCMIKSAGQKLMFLNGGPHYKVNPSISIYVNLLNEQEVNETWGSLAEEGNIMMPLDKYPWAAKYGWIQDKFGLNWQIALGTPESASQKFTPFFTFTGTQFGRAEEAVNFYTSFFTGSSIIGIKKHKEDPTSDSETVLHAQFQLCKQVFMAIDSGAPHQFQFDPGISLVINCQSQDEIDYYWENLLSGGKESMCGWLSDRFGVSWQVVPDKLGEWMRDSERSKRVSGAFMQMKKLDWDMLENA